MEKQALRIPSNVVQPLGLSRRGQQVALLYRSKRRGHNKLSLALSSDGYDFSESPDSPVIMASRQESEDISNIRYPRFATILSEHLLTYTRGSKVSMARRSYGDDFDLALWERIQTKLPPGSSATFIDEFKASGKYVLYFGFGSGINVALSKNLSDWRSPPAPILLARPGYFDSAGLSVLNAELIKQGILLTYVSSASHGRQRLVSVGVALLARDNPADVVWRSEEPLWHEAPGRNDDSEVIGSYVLGDHVLLYISGGSGKLRVVKLLHPYAHDVANAPKNLRLNRHHANPIITPEGGSEWEQAGTFNPGTVIHDGKVHMFYRAIAPDGISRFGYASSNNGIDFTRLPQPAYDHGAGFTPPSEKQHLLTYNYDRFASGGGWGGCEDPRAVIINDNLYMTFGVFESWQSMRMAVTTLQLENLKATIWTWAKPMIISPAGETHKNWMLFPEKIKGKFAILHALTPHVAIEYVERVEDIHNTPVQSNNQRSGRPGAWDGFVRGAAAPPIKTEAGWLLLYHGMDPRHPHVGYKVGAMLLDLNDPTKVLHRTSRPILVPSEWYENESKAGVVYASGAVVLGDNLFVYYGGGDRHVCVATANLKDFLEELTHDTEIRLSTVEE